MEQFWCFTLCSRATWERTLANMAAAMRARACRKTLALLWQRPRKALLALTGEPRNGPVTEEPTQAPSPESLAAHERKASAAAQPEGRTTQDRKRRCDALDR